MNRSLKGAIVDTDLTPAALLVVMPSVVGLCEASTGRRWRMRERSAMCVALALAQAIQSGLDHLRLPLGPATVGVAKGRRRSLAYALMRYPSWASELLRSSGCRAGQTSPLPGRCAPRERDKEVCFGADEPGVGHLIRGAQDRIRQRRQRVCLTCCGLSPGASTTWSVREPKR